MKKIILAATIMLLTLGNIQAQNNFRGIVKYKIESTGKVDISIKPEQSTTEIKVYDNKILSGQTIQTDFKVAQAADFSQAIAYLAEEGYDPDFGARPVKRAIQQFVLNDLSKKILADEVDRTKPIVIDDFGDGLVFRN